MDEYNGLNLNSPTFSTREGNSACWQLTIFTPHETSLQKRPNYQVRQIWNELPNFLDQVDDSSAVCIGRGSGEALPPYWCRPLLLYSRSSRPLPLHLLARSTLLSSPSLLFLTSCLATTRSTCSLKFSMKFSMKTILPRC